jgi:phosphoribosylformylglycinamidine synthase
VSAVHRVEIQSTPEAGDALAVITQRRLAQWLDLHPRRVVTRRVYHLDLALSDAEARRVADAIVDPIAEIGTVGMLPDSDDDPLVLTVGFRPGVTDSVGTSVRRAAEDCLGRSLPGTAYTSTMYLVWGLSREQLERAAAELLWNPLIERMRIDATPRTLDLEVPRAGADAPPRVQTIALREADDAQLQRLSSEGMLALTLAEMHAIKAHFVERGRDPTDAEVECLAQTWSEHCKHKIFAAPIDYTSPDGEVTRIDEGLFRRYIRGATEAVAQRRGDDFLVSVFHDNAGVVRFTDADHLVYKVETHNSPSALDPYGGAMTGIVGVNRDAFGTGRGADLLANVWGYCFADSDYAGRIPAGLMHPRRLRDGVHHGVKDGGNQSGIPYARGFELFDDRYLGKPLVYCGTLSVMPVQSAGEPTHEKRVEVGHSIVMVGGRIGKDGIHGATFSSAELDEHAPVQAVQIGDPITQKMMFDMLAEARDRGLLSGMTDNGAGGLSSSVGEMAELTGGARIDLAAAPLKYPGLQPWEILVSEAQERMTVAVAPDQLPAFLGLAAAREVEATVLGEFTDSGRFEVTYGEQSVVDLPLSFLHEGWPRSRLRARLQARRAPAVDWRPTDDGIGGELLALLSRPNLRALEGQARGYDHEVKGLSAVKPFVGQGRDVPATATVLRVRHGRPQGVVLAEGIHPHYGDLDAHAMAQAAVDEAVRRVLCAGARWDRLAALDNFCWPDPIESAKTPDGAHKLAQLVRCCQGLREACEAYGLPLISGKDSMKNDAVLDGVKISIPPTLLVSVMGQMADVRNAITLVPRTEGDIVWLLGASRGELGGSEVQRLLGFGGGDVPRTELAHDAAAYQAFVRLRDRGLVRSAHVTSRGGLAVALAHMVMASHRVLTVRNDTELSSFAWIFGESTGRIVFTTSPEHAESIEQELEAHAHARLGIVGPRDSAGALIVERPRGAPLRIEGSAMSRAYHRES